MTQSQHIAGEASLSCSSLSPMALLLYPASAHSNLAFNGLAKAAMAFFQCCAGVLTCIALASLPASSCPCCRRFAGIVAKLAFEGPASAALAFAGVVLAFPPRSAGIIASIVLLLSLLALRRRCRPWRAGLCLHCAPLVVMFALSLSLPYVVSSPYPLSLMPVLHFLLSDALAAMHVPFAMMLSSERLTAAAAVLVTTIPQGTAGCAI
jgi:hypothetical protein